MKYGVIFGGNSFEHEISIVSAIVLKKVFRGDMSFIFVSSDRRFWLISPDKMNAKTFSSGAFAQENELILRQGGFFGKKFLGEKRLECDIFINLSHGRDGEDGKIASLCEFYGLNYIGPRIEASVLSFNKALTKLYAQSVGVKTLPYQLLKRSDNGASLENTKFPCIIKPARLGSSIGISVVHSADELSYALDIAFEFDEEVLAEPFVSDIREFNLAGCKVKDEFLLSLIEEPQKKELLDFEQKYLSFSGRGEVSEAALNESLKSKMKTAFERIYDPLFRGALIRCDFFAINDEIYLNEINPNPGSMANYLFRDFSVVLERLANSVHCGCEKRINIDYAFLHSISGAKGKL